VRGGRLPFVTRWRRYSHAGDATVIIVVGAKKTDPQVLFFRSNLRKSWATTTTASEKRKLNKN
jgi:hypothetical protein